MHFLVDASLPRGTAPLIRSYRYEATDVRDIGLGQASDEVIATHAIAHQQCLMSGDFDFADIRGYPPVDYHGIVVFEIPTSATRAFILRMVQSVLMQPQVVAQLPGRLAIVDAARIRLRPA